MIERTATVASRVGLHARPAAAFAEAASAYDNLEITIAHEGEPAEESTDATSILGLMSLGINHGDKVVLRASGDDAPDALDHLVKFLEIDHDAN